MASAIVCALVRQSQWGDGWHYLVPRAARRAKARAKAGKGKSFGKKRKGKQGQKHGLGKKSTDKGRWGKGQWGKGSHDRGRDKGDSDSNFAIVGDWWRLLAHVGPVGALSAPAGDSDTPHL